MCGYVLLRISILFGCCAFLVHTGSSTSPSSAWETIFALDCEGAMHFAPDSVFATTIKTPAKNIIKGFMDELQDRIDCWCSDNGLSSDDFEKRYDPVTAMLNAMQPGEQPSPACLDGEKYTRDLVKFLNELDPLGKNFEAQGPDSCTLENYLSEGCFLKAPLPDMDLTLQVAVSKCPSPSRHPYVSLTCAGSGCRVGHPCKTDSDCGSEKMKCETLVTQDTFAEAEKDIFEFLQYAHFYGEDATLQTATPRPTVIITNMLNHFAEYFPGSPNDLEHFAVCVWSDLDKMDDSWDNLWDAFSSTEIEGGHVIKVDPASDYSWDGVLANGGSALASNRLDGSHWGDKIEFGEVPGVIIGGVGCDGTISLLGSEAYGISVRLVHLMCVTNFMGGQLADIWKFRGRSLKNFKDNQQFWNLQFWGCNLVHGADCEHLLHDSVAFEMMGDEDWYTYNNGARLWTTWIDAAKKVVVQQMEHNFRQKASWWEKVQVSVGWREAYPGLQAKLQQLQDSIDQATERLSQLVDIEKLSKVIPSQAQTTLKQLRTQLENRRLKTQQKRNNNKFAAQNYDYDQDIDDSWTVQHGGRVSLPNTCNYTTWTQEGNGYCAVRVTGASQVLGDALLDLKVQRCDAVPHTTPSGYVYCDGGVCDILDRALTCDTNADCSSLGNNFECSSIVGTVVGQDGLPDFAGWALWGEFDGYDPGWQTAQGSKFDESNSCWGKTKIKQNINNLYGAITGSKSSGNDLTLCLENEIGNGFSGSAEGDANNGNREVLLDFGFKVVPNTYGVGDSPLLNPNNFGVALTMEDNENNPSTVVKAWAEANADPAYIFHPDIPTPLFGEWTSGYRLAQFIQQVLYVKVLQPKGFSRSALSYAYLREMEKPVWRLVVSFRVSAGTLEQQEALVDVTHDTNFIADITKVLAVAATSDDDIESPWPEPNLENHGVLECMYDCSGCYWDGATCSRTANLTRYWWVVEEQSSCFPGSQVKLYNHLVAVYGHYAGLSDIQYDCIWREGSTLNRLQSTVGRVPTNEVISVWRDITSFMKTEWGWDEQGYQSAVRNSVLEVVGIDVVPGDLLPKVMYFTLTIQTTDAAPTQSDLDALRAQLSAESGVPVNFIHIEIVVKSDSKMQRQQNEAELRVIISGAADGGTKEAEQVKKAAGTAAIAQTFSITKVASIQENSGGAFKPVNNNDNTGNTDSSDNTDNGGGNTDDTDAGPPSSSAPSGTTPPTTPTTPTIPSQPSSSEDANSATRIPPPAILVFLLLFALTVLQL